MAAVPQTFFAKAVVIINGTAYPCLPSQTRLVCPKNYQVPPIIGNYWQVNFGVGIRQPMVDTGFAVLSSNTGVMSTTFLNYFMTRASDVTFDTTEFADGIVFWNGRSGFIIGGNPTGDLALTGPKADSFTLGSAKGDDLRFSARFVGTTLTPITTETQFTVGEDTVTGYPSPALMLFDRSALLRYKSINFTDGNLNNVVWSFNMSYSNNHTPNNPLDGTEFPAGQNAGIPTASFNMSVQAATLKTTDAQYNSAYGTVPDNGPPTGSDGDTRPDVLQTIQFTVSGNGETFGTSPSATPWTRTFTLNNPVDNTPDDHDVTAPRNMRQHQYICMGTDGQTGPPLTIT